MEIVFEEEIIGKFLTSNGSVRYFYIIVTIIRVICWSKIKKGCNSRHTQVNFHS
jgi:hypothetical protein